MDISTLSFAELKALSIKVTFAIKAAEATAIATARQQIAEIAKAAGISLDDLVGKAGTASAARKTGPVPIRFRNPDDAAQTWGGHGRNPGWLTALLATGKTKAEFAV